MSDNRPPCGHKYCSLERCGYMRPRGAIGEGLGTGLPNDCDYAEIELRVLEFLAPQRSAWDFHPFWWRILPKRIKHWVKRRKMRRYYGG